MADNSTLSDVITVEPVQTADAAVIWLHGLGADGNDFVPIVQQLGLSSDTTRFLFPHAPVRPVTINGGMPMRAWYDIAFEEFIIKEDERGLKESSAIVSKLIQEQRDEGIAAERIILAGFSQGGALTLYTGLRHHEPLCGLIVLSSYLPVHQTLPAEQHEANRQVPIFMAHGIMDPVVPIALGELSRSILQKSHSNLDWKTYPMLHQVCDEEIRDIHQWMETRLSA